MIIDIAQILVRVGLQQLRELVEYVQCLVQPALLVTGGGDASSRAFQNPSARHRQWPLAARRPSRAPSNRRVVPSSFDRSSACPSEGRSAPSCPPPSRPPVVAHRHTIRPSHAEPSSFCGGPNPCPLDQSSQAKHHHFDPRKQTPGGRLQIGTPAGFKSEWVAGFLLECVAGFVGIRRMGQINPMLPLKGQFR